MDSTQLTDLYASMTFNDDVMKERIPKSTYKQFHEALTRNEPMSREVATVIANAMKVWAVEKGATHFVHWFTPLSGNTPFWNQPLIIALFWNLAVNLCVKENRMLPVSHQEA